MIDPSFTGKMNAAFETIGDDEDRRIIARLVTLTNEDLEEEERAAHIAIAQSIHLSATIRTILMMRAH